MEAAPPAGLGAAWARPGTLDADYAGEVTAARQAAEEMREMGAFLRSQPVAAAALQSAVSGLQPKGALGRTRRDLRDEEMDAMLEIREAGGLCSTCNNASSCYHRATRGPALFCEMFDDYVAPADRGVASVPEPAAAAVGNGKHAGLCVNCANRDSCMYPKPPGGVWHCEGYE